MNGPEQTVICFGAYGLSAGRRRREDINMKGRIRTPIENVSNDKIPGGGSFMFVRGGEQIDHIQHKGSGTDPVRIDPDAMADSLNHLPAITAPDKSTMRIAASGILAAMAAGGLVIGGREMLLQQKTDEVFENQYGISRTELLLKSGPKQKEYVAAYNSIYNGLQQEMKEIKQEEIDRRLDLISKEIEVFSKDDNLQSVREVNRLTIDEVNLKNERLAIEDGKRRPHVPYDKTYVAGLSEKEMLYLMDHGGMSPGRFATVLNTLNQSDEYKFVIQDDETYWFKDDKTQLKVAHDGSKISIIKAFAGKECSADAEMGLGDASQFDGYSWNSKKPSEVGREHAANIENGPSISASGSCGAALNYREDWFTISEEGSILSAGYEVKLGPDAYAEGSGNVQGVTASAGVEAAKAEVSGTMSTRPMKVGRTIVQGGAEVTIGGTIGASGNVDFSVKQGVKAKAGISALLKVGAQGQLSLLSLDKLPPEVAGRLSESLPSTKQAAEEMLIRMAEVDLASSRIKP